MVPNTASRRFNIIIIIPLRLNYTAVDIPGTYLGGCHGLENPEKSLLAAIATRPSARSVIARVGSNSAAVVATTTTSIALDVISVEKRVACCAVASAVCDIGHAAACLQKIVARSSRRAAISWHKLGAPPTPC